MWPNMEADMAAYNPIYREETQWRHTCPLCGREFWPGEQPRRELGYDLHEACFEERRENFDECCRNEFDDPNDSEAYRREFHTYLADEIAEGVYSCEEEAEIRRHRGENIEYYYSK